MRLWREWYSLRVVIFVTNGHGVFRLLEWLAHDIGNASSTVLPQMTITLSLLATVPWLAVKGDVLSLQG